MTATAVTSSPTGSPPARNNIPNSNNSRLAFVDLTSAGRHLTSVLGIGPAFSSPLSAISFTGTNGTARRQFVDSTVPVVASNATSARTPTIPATSSSTPSPRGSAELSTATTTTIPLHSSKTTTTIIANSKRPTIIIYPTVSPESIVIPIVSCILGFPLLALLVICCLRRRAKLARERDRRRNYDMQDHAVSLVRYSPIHRLNNRSSRAISLRPERSLSRGFPSLELDTVIEERSDPEQTQIDMLSPESPLDPQKYRDFNSS